MLIPCDHCGCFVFVGTSTCPHCDHQVRAGRIRRTATAAMLAASVACTGSGEKDSYEPLYGATTTDVTVEPEYGVTITDTDADADADADTDADSDTDTDTADSGITIEPEYGVTITDTTDSGTR